MKIVLVMTSHDDYILVMTVVTRYLVISTSGFPNGLERGIQPWATSSYGLDLTMKSPASHRIHPTKGSIQPPMRLLNSELLDQASHGLQIAIDTSYVFQLDLGSS